MYCCFATQIRFPAAKISADPAKKNIRPSDYRLILFIQWWLNMEIFFWMKGLTRKYVLYILKKKKKK